MVAPPAGQPPTPFAILAGQRTGSTWLRDVLDSHPEVAAYTELMLEGEGTPPLSERFGPTDVDRFERWLRARWGNAGRLARARGGVPYLRHLYERPTGVRATGFKLMYSQALHNPVALAYIAARRVRVVHLVRENLLDVVISTATAAARDRPHAWSGEEVEQVRVPLDPAATLARLRRLSRQRVAARAYLRATRLPAVELTYERLRADPSGFEAAFALLGVDPAAAAPSPMRKLNRAPRGELVENWAELREALGGTRFAPLLDG